MKCIECGHELKDGAIFCIRCGAMQVSMDGTPLKKDSPDQASDQGWSSVSPEPVGNRPSVTGQHTREYQSAPQGGGMRIALIIVVAIVVIALIAFLGYSCMGPASSGSSSSTGAAAGTTASESSASASSGSSDSSSASSASASASSASASASSASASASSASASSAAQNTPTIVNESQQQQTQPQQEAQPQAQPQPQAQVGTEPSNAPAPDVGNGYVLGDTNSRYYSEAELQNLSASELYYARNEIFARHGRMFQRSDLQSYFDSKGWYTRTYTPAQWDSMGNQLNDYEQKNINLMMQVEKSKGSPYL